MRDKRDLYTHGKKSTKETYKRDLQKRPTKETTSGSKLHLTSCLSWKRLTTETHVSKETYESDVSKETYERDLQKRQNEGSIVALDELFVVEETYNRAQRDRIHKKRSTEETTSGAKSTETKM